MKMKKIAIIIIVAAALLATILYARRDKGLNISNGPGSNAPTQQNDEANSVSTGAIKWSYPDNFGLAVTSEQLKGMVQSYIPPCEEGFDYCLYYKGADFKGTNFESAGIRVNKRADLTTERLCLNTPPAGRTNMGNSTASTSAYSASIFSPLGDAAAGHYSNGELYRVYILNDKSCTEIETRIGESQFDNFPAGTIKRFGESDRDKVYEGFRSILNSLKISATGETIRLPDSED
jgi:hypothetical protein